MSTKEESRCNLYAHREAQAWAPKKKRLPVTLVTGFLGSGKTSLLTHILNNKHNLKIAAAVNDFASLNIDGQIVRRTSSLSQGGVVELSNGCLCCSVSGEFRRAVWGLLQEADIGKIDYLVVETSGVTDPLQTIATLEQEYGQMYRVRLDVVVTVVDTDHLVTTLREDAVLRSVAADSQLKCADVVLLNKKDLVSDEDLKQARDFVTFQVPGAVVHACTHGAVPLNWIMEVNEVASGPQVVSHEVIPAAYIISSAGGIKNSARRERGETIVNVSSNHLSADEFQSVVFERSSPLSLDAFQRFLGAKFPPGLVRMKGTVWFQENRSLVYLFHMSGRQRYELTPQDTYSHSGAFKVELVAIGRDIQSSVEHALEECLYQKDHQSLDETLYRAVCDTVTSHDYFVLETDRDAALVYVDFRVTGCVDYGVTEEEASSFHGINFGRMNRDIAVRVNGSSQKVSVLPVQLPNGLQVCRHGVSLEAGFEETWKVLTCVAEKIVAEYYRAVGVCKCGR